MFFVPKEKVHFRRLSDYHEFTGHFFTWAKGSINSASSKTKMPPNNQLPAWDQEKSMKISNALFFFMNRGDFLANIVFLFLISISFQNYFCVNSCVILILLFLGLNYSLTTLFCPDIFGHCYFSPVAQEKCTKREMYYRKLIQTHISLPTIEHATELEFLSK